MIACGGDKVSTPDSAELNLSTTEQSVTGQDGALPVTVAGTIVNQYGVLAANVTAGSTTITVTNINDFPAASPFTTALAANDLIMLYQPAGATINAAENLATYGTPNIGNAGLYELVHVTAVAGNTITIESTCGGLRNAYTTAGRTQVIRVPQATTLDVSGAGSIVPRVWDGARGGVVALSVQSTATIGAGGIDASGAGFRGGQLSVNGAVGSSAIKSLSPTAGAEKGESIAGDGTTYDTSFGGRFGLGAPANGGGGGDSVSAPGGGGANGLIATGTYTGAGFMDNTVIGSVAWTHDPEFVGGLLTTSPGGGRGGYSHSLADLNATLIGPDNSTWLGDERRNVGGRGGRALTASAGTRVFMGGGGGAGATVAGLLGGTGGQGGGFVFLIADSVTGTGAILANGADGGDSSGDGPGGGGGGGTIVIKANTLTGVALHADGGAGGDHVSVLGASGGGGGGGGGFIAISAGAPTRTADGGLGGTTNSATLNEFPTNGATKGAGGQATVAVATVPVCTPVDLSITNTNNVATSTPGTATSYTIVARNNGADKVVNAVVTDAFPAAITGVTWTCTASAGSTCPANGSNNINVNVTLLPAGTATFTANGTISPSATGALANTANIAAPTGVTDPDNTNNSATDTDTLTPTADLSISVADSPDPVGAGANLTYTVNVSNAGPSDAASLTMTDTLPAGVGFVSANGTNWDCSESGGVVTCTRATLAVGAAPAITIVVTAPANPGSITNNVAIAATSTDPVAGNDTASTDTNVTARADLAVSITDSADPIVSGGTLTYTVNVTNNGPSTAQSVTLTDTIPATATLVSADGTGWTCNAVAGTVTCTRASLAASTSAPVTIVVTAPVVAVSTNITNTASVNSTTADPVAGNNTDSEQTTVTASADLSIAITDAPDPVTAGGSLVYTINVANSGPSTAANPSVSHTLPAGAGFVSAVGTGWACSQTGGVVTCNRSTPLASGQAAQALVVTVNAPANGPTANSTATVSSTTPDPATANNTDSASTTVNASANLAIAVTDAPDPVNATANVTYTVAVSNAGPSTAANLVMTDTLPAGVTFVSALGTGWACNQAAGVVTCTRPTLAVGAAPNIAIVVTAPAEPGTLTNVATIASDTGDPVLGNNSDTDTTTVNARADLAISKSDSPDPVATGGTLTYTIDVTNNGPSTAASLTMTDTLPAQVTFVSATGTGWTCNQIGVLVTCTRPTLAVGAAPPITIVVTAPLVAQVISNTATIAALPASADTVAGNNTSTITTNVTPSTDLEIAVADSSDPVEALGTLAYTIDVNNAGPIAATNVSMVDTLPAGVAFQSAAGTGWSCGVAGQVVTCTRATLPVGQAEPITIIVTPTAVDNTTIDNVVTITSSTVADPDLTDNTANETTLVIDREIDVVPGPAIPDTFRNPGSTAPVSFVTVQNTGMATLHVTSVSLTSADPNVWTLVDTLPQDIPPGASVDYRVKFSPTSVGQAPTATLTLNSDDRTEPVTQIAFDGKGVDRNVVFADAPRVNLGFTGVGVPVRFDEALLVRSLNVTNNFVIRSVEITDADPSCLAGATNNVAAFTLTDAPAGEALPASGERPVAMTFASDAEGHFVASARLFLDEDPEPQSTICVEGTAVFVDAHGGGGCATGGNVGGGALIWLAVGVVLVRIRRRRLVAGAIVIAVASSAQADKIVLSTFDPTPATTGMTFQLQNAEVGTNGLYTLTTSFSLATDPLILDASVNGQARVIERSTQLTIGGAYAFGGRFEAGARMPLYLQSGAARGDSLMMFTADPADGASTGDLTMHGKVRLLKHGGFALGAGAQLTLPTANEDSFTGTEKPSLRVLGLASLVPDTLDRRISLTGQFGGIARAKSQFANLEQGSGMTWGLGLTVRALDRMWFSAEVFGDLLPSARKDTAMANATALSPTEWLAGIRFVPDDRFNIGVALGKGLTAAAGSPALRAVLGIAYTPGAPELRPIKVYQAPKPDGDSDGDGIPDSKDKCPNEAEDKDMFQDDDGCPDPDNDGDKIPDVNDKCPLDPEDYDGFQDDDGCPDKDNDNDGIPDAMDKCPNEPEDKDGFEDIDGCPELDNDKDGIEDSKDKCPNEPETINGNKDDDGCPDAGDSSIVLSPDRIETLDTVTFDRGARIVISKSSFNVLGQVAATMRAHPEIIRLRVTAHVHPTGNYDKDQELSDKRAAAVRDWLVQWGLPVKRVEARGFGGSKPLAPVGQRGAQAINDRIEFIILERK